jgi:hypothetical protein
MAKMSLGSEEVKPNPKPEIPQDPVEKLLGAWYKELEEMHYKSSASYEVEGLKALFEDKDHLQALMSRVDVLMAKGNRLHRKVQNALNAAKDLMEDELDKVRSHPERFIAKSYAYQERESCYRSAPQLIAARIRIRELERQVSDCETFVKVITHKYWHFEGFRKDQLTQTNLIRLGYSLREFEPNPNDPTN